MLVNVNSVVPIIFLVVIFMSFPLMIQAFVWFRSKGKHLCAILEKGKPLDIRMLQIYKDEFVKDKDDTWILDTTLMKPVDFPIGWPPLLGIFQKRVWCSLVQRGRAEPLDWSNPSISKLSSKELPDILDPHWLKALVKGIEEGTGGSKRDRIILYLAAGAGTLSLLVSLYIVSKIGNL